MVGAACGALGFAISRILTAPVGLSSLIGWNTACLVFLALISTLLFEDEETVRARASVEDEGAQMMTLLVVFAVAASLAATFLALNESKAVASHAPNARPWPLALSVSTMAMSWLVIQAIFTLRYAHSYFGDEDRDGEINGGVKFPGEQPRKYSDFIYMAVCVGCTSQVSDFNIETNGFRNLVTTHAIISFTFNVSVLALGINMVASLIGQ
jgi:uncharacterized membrane protein